MGTKESRRVPLTAKREVKTTEAIRLKIALENERCPYCGQYAFEVYATKGPIRYVKCRGCGDKAKVAVSGGIVNWNVEESSEEKEQEGQETEA